MVLNGYLEEQNVLTDNFDRFLLRILVCKLAEDQFMSHLKNVIILNNLEEHTLLSLLKDVISKVWSHLNRLQGWFCIAVNL